MLSLNKSWNPWNYELVKISHMNCIICISNSVSYNLLRLLTSLYLAVFLLVDVSWSWRCVVHLVGLGVVLSHLWRWDENPLSFMHQSGPSAWGTLLLWTLPGIYALLFDVLSWWVPYYITNVIGNSEKIHFSLNFENWFGARVFLNCFFLNYCSRV